MCLLILLMNVKTFSYIYAECIVKSRNYYYFAHRIKTDSPPASYYFCHTYLQRGDRTIDQMVQAARSGKQNIVEGCMASGTSAKTELKLLNVAKASLHELREDYEDYLKTSNHRQWEEDSVELAAMRKIGSTHNDGDYFMELARTRPPETIANMTIVLLKQADYLLHRQIQRLSEDFIKEGGFSERMMRMRKDYRNNGK